LGRAYVCPIRYDFKNFLRARAKKFEEKSVAPRFSHSRLAEAPDAIAPDGSEVRLLATSAGGSMAHFRLLPGGASRAIRHRSVEELWYFVAGHGEMWRKHGGDEEVLPVHAGLSLDIPAGASFQFRAAPDTQLEAVGVTMPPWPGAGWRRK
jgi:mannose-6-phosphate isomerase-like protein (cupin superfamily)